MRPRIDSSESIPPAYVVCAGIFKLSMWARSRVGIGFSFWPARLYSLAEWVPRNRFLGSLKSLKIRALAGRYRYDNTIPSRVPGHPGCSKFQKWYFRTIYETALSYRPASLCSLAGRYYYNFIPTRFLAPL